MLVEQIFELRGPGLHGSICTPITDCFHDKTILPLRKIFDWIVISAKILQEAMRFTSSTWAKSITKFNPKMQDFKEFET